MFCSGNTDTKACPLTRSRLFPVPPGEEVRYGGVISQERLKTEVKFLFIANSKSYVALIGTTTTHEWPWVALNGRFIRIIRYICGSWASCNSCSQLAGLDDVKAIVHTWREFAEQRAVSVAEFSLFGGSFHGLDERTPAVQVESSASERPRLVAAESGEGLRQLLMLGALLVSRWRWW